LKGGTMARYGIGYDDLKKINPRIIFCSVTGYGQTGPKKSDPAIDTVIQAVSGMMSITGTPETGPLKTGSTIVDYTTGYAAALAIVTALFQRSRTGVGQAIDVAMLETAMTMMGGEVQRAINDAETPPLVGNASGKGGYVSDTYRCKEGHLSIAAAAKDYGRQWRPRTFRKIRVFATTPPWQKTCRRSTRKSRAGSPPKRRPNGKPF
jgi:CoA:oxalate CoA-transferase